MTPKCTVIKRDGKCTYVEPRTLPGYLKGLAKTPTSNEIVAVLKPKPKQ